MKHQHIWIYEYKDDDTPIGATLLDKFVDDLGEDELKLPHLQEPWHWRINFAWKEREENSD